MKKHLKLYVFLLAVVIPNLGFSKSFTLSVRVMTLDGAKTATNARTITPIEKCLNVATNLPNDCINRSLKNKTLSNCYALSETIFSYHSKERVKNYCFYNISEFPSLQTCTAAAKKFFIAENKDQALFECVRQFTSQIDERSCLEIARMMTYREKRSYLENHCHNL